jgi:hypothetical protein
VLRQALAAKGLSLLARPAGAPMAVDTQFRRFVSKVRPESDDARASRALSFQVIRKSILSRKLTNERQAVFTVVHGSLPCLSVQWQEEYVTGEPGPKTTVNRGEP